jgi:hypothetical protein
MARFVTAQLAGDDRLGEGVVELMQRRHFAQDDRVPGMGYGYVEGQRGGHRVLLKDGDLPGFHSNLALLPDRGIGIFVAYNGDGADGAAFWDAKDLVHRIIDHYAPLGPRAPAATAIAPGDPAGYTGSYRASTTSERSLMKVSALTAPVTVEATDDGLLTYGLALDPATGAQHWAPLGPGLFVSDDGQDRLAFDENGILVGPGPEATAYERVAWYQDPTLHLSMLGFGAAVLVIAFFWFPVAAGVRRRRRHPQPSGGLRTARATGWTSGALAVVFCCGFALLASDGNRLQEAGVLGPPLLTILPFVTSAMILTGAGVVVATPVAWHRRWWSMPGLLGYTILALATIAFLSVLISYNLAALGDLRGS